MPERDIEQQLRASAEQRRAEAGGPFELHAATRRLLQTEVARRFAGRGADSASAQSWWLLFWPRAALGASLIALIGLCVWVSVTPPARTKPDSDVARTPAKGPPIAASDSAKKLAETSRPDSPTPGAAPATPPAQSLALDETMKTERVRATTADGEPGTARKTITLPRESLTLVERPTGTRTSVQQSGSAERSQADKFEIASATPATDTNGRQEYQFRPPARARSVESGPSGGRGGGGGGFGGGGLAGRGSGMAGGSLSPAARANAGVNAPVTDEPKNVRAVASAPTLGGPSSLYDTNILLAKEKDSVSATSTSSLARAQRELSDRVEATNARFYRNQIVSAGGGRRGSARGGGAGGGGGGGGAAFRSIPAPMAPMVLDSFRVEQSGDTLNIVDADGSIYQGKVQAASATDQSTEATAQLRRQPAAPASQSKPGESPAWTAKLNFIVTGMNRSLAQGVVFTGQMQQAAPPQTLNLQIGGTPTPTRAAQGVVQTDQASADRKQASQAGALSRIVGRAVVGQTNQLDVDALGTPR